MKKLVLIPRHSFAFTYPCPRNLREIVMMSLIERESSDKVRDVWMDYHKDRYNSVAYAISKQEFLSLKQKTKESPMFILPIKNAKSSGHYILLGQGQEKSYMFTYLEDFKKLGTNATPYFVLTCFDELINKKDLCLIRGDIIDVKIGKQDALFLMNQTLSLYLTPHLYQKFIYSFNHDQQNFVYEDFQKQYEIS